MLGKTQTPEKRKLIKDDQIATDISIEDKFEIRVIGKDNAAINVRAHPDEVVVREREAALINEREALVREREDLARERALARRNEGMGVNRRQGRVGQVVIARPVDRLDNRDDRPHVRRFDFRDRELDSDGQSE